MLGVYRKVQDARLMACIVRTEISNYLLTVERDQPERALSRNLKPERLPVPCSTEGSFLDLKDCREIRILHCTDAQPGHFPAPALFKPPPLIPFRILDHYITRFYRISAGKVFCMSSSFFFVYFI